MFYSNPNMQTLNVRIDKYLWSIRIFKTRALASKACVNGKVILNGQKVKARKYVTIGDCYEIQTPAKDFQIIVKELVYKRVSAKEAINLYEDISVHIEKNETEKNTSTYFTGKRWSKIGRPTKKKRRHLDNFINE